MYASSVKYTIKMIYMIWDKQDMVHSIVHKLANLCNEHYYPIYKCPFWFNPFR